MKNLLFFILFFPTVVLAQTIDFEADTTGSPYDPATDFTVSYQEEFSNHTNITTAEAHTGSKSLEVSFDTGESRGVVSRLNITAASEYVLNYWVKFETGFNFNGSLNSGGKLPGLGSGDSCAGGATCTGTNGFSSRLMWRENGRAVLYLYHMNKAGTFGDDIQFTDPVSGSNMSFTAGQWHKITMHLRINTGTNLDGFVTVDMDGRRVVESTGLQFVNNGDLIDRFLLSTFFGGNDVTWNSQQDQSVFFDDISLTVFSPKAYPNAEGGGADKVAYRDPGYKVVHITSDGDSSGAPTTVSSANKKYTGTLRQCLTGITGARTCQSDIALDIDSQTTEIVVSDSNANFALLAHTNPTRLSCEGIDYQGAPYYGRCLVLNRWGNTNKHFMIRGLRMREGRNTGTALADMPSSLQNGGNLVIDDVDGGVLYMNSISHCNDDCLAIWGSNPGSGHKGYSQNITIQKNLFTRAASHLSFPKYAIVFANNSATVPSGSDTGLISFFQNASTGGARFVETKGPQTSFVNNVSVGYGFNYGQYRSLGGGFVDVRYNLLQGQQGERNKPIDIDSYSSSSSIVSLGFPGTANYLIEGNWSEFKAWNGRDSANFKEDTNIINPVPTPIAVRTPIGDIAASSVITSPTTLRTDVLADVGASYYLNCDGTKTTYRDKTDKLAVKEIREARTFLSTDEAIEGGFQTLVGHASCADTDNDNLWDSYEQRFWSDLDETYKSDFDGDGIDNYWEFINSTDPTDATDF